MLTIRRLPPCATADPAPLLIKRLLLSGRRYEPHREIVYRDHSRYSYATFIERVARLANVLTASGVRAGDTVAVMDWDSHRYLECMFAVPMIGAVLHTINVRLSAEQILYTMNHAEDRLVLVNSEFIALYQGIAEQLTTVRNTLLISDAGLQQAALPDLLGEYEQLLAAAPAQYDFPDFDENALATTFYTTGTTGNPKGVYFTHRQLVLHTLAEASVLAGLDSIRLLGSDDVYMPITPMFHVHAWGIPYVATMLGIKQVYPGRYDADLLVQLQQREKVTFSHCVPTIMQMILACPAAQTADLSGWKLIIGGSALTSSLHRAAAQRGIQLSAAYGMSETCPLIACAHLNDSLRAGSEAEQASYLVKAGVAVPLVEARLMDEHGRLLAEDGETQGELVLRAPWLTQGYVGERERSAELWQHGWLHTGDVATLDEMGFIDIRDRIKDVIKTGGEWLSSLALEELISRHPAIAEAAVVGLPDPQWGERPFALVVLKTGQTLDAAALKMHLKPFVEQGLINKWAIPSQFEAVPSIPKTSVGKLDKKHIRAQVLQRQAGGIFLES